MTQPASGPWRPAHARVSVDVSEIMIRQNEPFQPVGRALVRKKVPWMAIKVPELAIDARREKNACRVQTAKTRRNGPWLRWPTADGERNRGNRDGRAWGAAPEQPSPAAMFYHDPGELLSRSWCHFIAIWGRKRGLARPSGCRFSRSRSVDRRPRAHCHVPHCAGTDIELSQ